ncbi:hypothetical protein L6R49_04725 [Myxococcota bacterium]|nr:hypothetical protein [Myxococcota bacterium]
MSVTALVARSNRVMIHQKKELLEMVTDFEGRNRYSLKDDNGAEIGYAAEESGGISGALLRSFMGRARAMTIHLYDTQRQKIGRVVKPFAFFFPTAEIYSGEEHIGGVEKLWTMFLPQVRVRDAQGQARFTLKRRFLRREFVVSDTSGRQVGLIAKKWGGALKEMFTDADSFGVEFSDPGLTENDRALLVASTFFIDCLFFDGR